MADAYETISGIIGEEMDKAWKSIITRAADAAVGGGTLAFDGAEGFDVDAIKQWALQLRAARLTCEFLPNIARPSLVQCRPIDVVDVSALHASAGSVGILGIEGRITIGAEIRF